MVNKEGGDSSYGIGVDIGGTKTLIIGANGKGHTIFKEKIKSSQDVETIIAAVDRCIRATGISRSKIVGIGVGVPGRVNSAKGIVLDTPALKWKNLRLKQQFQTKFSLPVFVNNDVNLAAIGEKWLGNAKNCRDIFYIAFGTGVGSAVIANGQIIEGVTFSAGEIGYFIDKDDIREGRTNSILNFGTFERKTSGTALAEKGVEYGYSPRELFVEFQKGNPKVTPIIEDFVSEITIAIANVVSLINPEIVIIGGGVSESMGCVINAIRDRVAKITPISTKIELSKLGGEAGAFGGIAYVWEKAKKNKKLEGKK